MNSAAAGTTIDPRWARLLDALHPDEFPLRERVKEQFDAAMIDHISRADYGHDAERHRRAVSDLLAARTWPGELDWVPLEVLQLTRWSRPELPDGPLPPTGRRGHLMRLFACMALIRMRTPNGLPVDTLAPFVASAVELGSPFLDDAVPYLAWCRRHEPGDWRDDPADLPFLTFALLLLATATRAEPDVLGGLGACCCARWRPWPRSWARDGGSRPSRRCSGRAAGTAPPGLVRPGRPFPGGRRGRHRPRRAAGRTGPGRARGVGCDHRRSAGPVRGLGSRGVTGQFRHSHQ
ncbi:hypothetical protein ACFQY4_21180 [Catellatospora bangladeshensis]|uniref:hypothetical protein n=1 Tax=Catellatospora bangladeshensis TaxID=310355 RepID=UPI0036086518